MERRGRAWMRWGWAVAAVLVATTAWADRGQSATEVRKQAESSLLVSGNIVIEPDGAISQVTVNHEDQLPEAVRAFVHESVAQWKFKPLQKDGKPTRATAPMSARLVARKLDNRDFQIAIRGVSFNKYDAKDRQIVTSVQMDPPSYPESAYRRGVQGTVYLIAKVGRDGSVQDAFAEQVNLGVYAREGQMRMFREILSKSALDAARHWKFQPPLTGRYADAAFWTVRVPIAYRLDRNEKSPAYGHWDTYIPGPRMSVPWATGQDRADFSPDALAEGGVYMANADDQDQPKLLTPLQGG